MRQPYGRHSLHAVMEKEEILLSRLGVALAQCEEIRQESMNCFGLCTHAGVV